MGKQWSPQEEESLLNAVRYLPLEADRGAVLTALNGHLSRWPGRTVGGLYTHLAIIADRNDASLAARGERVRIAVRAIEREARAEGRRARHFNPQPDPNPEPPPVPSLQEESAGTSEYRGPDPELLRDPDYRHFHDVFIGGDEEIPAEVVASFGSGSPAPQASARPNPHHPEKAPLELLGELQDLCCAYRRWPGLISPEAFAQAVLRAVEGTSPGT